MVAIVDPLRSWRTITLDDAREELRRSEALAALFRLAAESEPQYAAVHRMTVARADERASAYRRAIAAADGGAS